MLQEKGLWDTTGLILKNLEALGTVYGAAWISNMNSWNLSTFVCKSGNNTNPGRLCWLNETIRPEGLEESLVEGLQYLCWKRTPCIPSSDLTSRWQRLLVIYPTSSSPFLSWATGPWNKDPISHPLLQLGVVMRICSGQRDINGNVTYSWNSHIIALACETRIGKQ